MNANNIAVGTRERQLPVLPDPVMNLKLTQQQQQQQEQQQQQQEQQQQQQQQQLPQQVPITKPVADAVSDSNLVQAGAEKVQQIAEGVADSLNNAAGTQALL